jgi:hypothetical protein
VKTNLMEVVDEVRPHLAQNGRVSLRMYSTDRLAAEIDCQDVPTEE